jgi:hypothetical protein
MNWQAWNETTIFDIYTTLGTGIMKLEQRLNRLIPSLG